MQSGMWVSGVCVCVSDELEAFYLFALRSAVVMNLSVSLFSLFSRQEYLQQTGCINTKTGEHDQ